MSVNNGIIRVLVIGLILLVAEVVPAFAEKVTLACSRDPTQYVTLYYTFDMDAMGVKDAEGGVFPIQVTDDEIYWKVVKNWGSVVHVYNRQSAQLVIYYYNGAQAIACQRAPHGPL